MVRNAQRVVKYLSPVTPPPVVVQPAPAVIPMTMTAPARKRSRNSHRNELRSKTAQRNKWIASIVIGGILGSGIAFYLISTLEIYAHIWK